MWPVFEGIGHGGQRLATLLILSAPRALIITKIKTNRWVERPLTDLDATIAHMETTLCQLTTRDDPRRHFHATYLRTTKAIRAELATGGFRDPRWVGEWCVAFAKLYLKALETDRRGGWVPDPWAAAFAFRGRARSLPPLQHVLLGMNAHINYDLPLALLSMMTDSDFDDPDLLQQRTADHHHVDRVLLARVAAEGSQLGSSGRRRPVEALLRPANELATKRFLTEARRKAWANAFALASACSRGEPEYRARCHDLEDLVTRRAADVVRPGPVLLRLGVRGFGVVLPSAGSKRPAWRIPAMARSSLPQTVSSEGGY